MTAQIHEVLTLDGKRTSMAFCPGLPEGHSRIVAVDPETARAKAGAGILFSTAYGRGYRGSWKIQNKRLYRVRLTGRYRLQGRGPLFAEWFSGVLRVPQGRLLRYVHMGFGSLYEQELRLGIKKGVVTSRRMFDNRTRRYSPR